MHKISGKVTVCGTTAYVAQTSCIQNDTFRGNILFGYPMNGGKYKEVIRVCRLAKDLEIMEDGDQTELESEESISVAARSNGYNLLEPYIRTVMSIFLMIYLALWMLKLDHRYIRNV